MLFNDQSTLLTKHGTWKMVGDQLSFTGWSSISCASAIHRSNQNAFSEWIIPGARPEKNHRRKNASGNHAKLLQLQDYTYCKLQPMAMDKWSFSPSGHSKMISHVADWYIFDCHGNTMCLNFDKCWFTWLTHVYTTKWLWVKTLYHCFVGYHHETN